MSKVACRNSIAQCRNVEIICRNCRNCRNSDWSIISICQNLSKLTKSQRTIVEKWIIARWNRLVETSRMVVKSCLYEIYMARKCAKHQKIGISFYVTAPFYVLHNSYGLSDQKIMKYSSLNHLVEMSRMVVKSCSYETYMARKYAKHQKIRISFYVTVPFYVLHDSTPYISHTNMILPPFDSSLRDDSNKLYFINFWSLNP